jgi:hypothetical protein
MGHVNPPAALPAQFQGLIYEPSFVRFVTQRGEVESRVGSLARNLHACLRDGLPLPRGKQVEVLLARKIQGHLE